METPKKGGDLIRFILQYVITNDVVDIDVAKTWADHANKINNSTKQASETAVEIEKWMGYVKDKIGARKYCEIRRAYENYCKDDCGFTTNDVDFKILLEQMFDVLGSGQSGLK